jgi:hypothetical protein
MDPFEDDEFGFQGFGKYLWKELDDDLDDQPIAFAKPEKYATILQEEEYELESDDPDFFPDQ